MKILARALVWVCATSLLWLAVDIVADGAVPSAVPVEQTMKEIYEQAAATWRWGAREHRKVGCTGLAICEDRMGAYYECLARALGGSNVSCGVEPSMNGCPQCNMSQKDGAAVGAARGGTGGGGTGGLGTLPGFGSTSPSGYIAPGALIPADAVPKEINFAGPTAPRVERKINMEVGTPETTIDTVAAPGSLRDLAGGDAATREAKYGGLDVSKPLSPELVNSALDGIAKSLESIMRPAPSAREAGAGAGANTAVSPAAGTAAAMDPGAASPGPEGRGWGSNSVFGRFMHPNELPVTSLQYGPDGRVLAADSNVSQVASDKASDLLMDAAAISASPLSSLRGKMQKLGGLGYYANGEAIGTALLDPDARERVRERADASENILVNTPADRMFDRFVRVVNYPVYIVKKFNEGVLNPALKSIYSSLDEVNRNLGGGSER